jgi:hypothetical protein
MRAAVSMEFCQCLRAVEKIHDWLWLAGYAMRGFMTSGIFIFPKAGRRLMETLFGDKSSGPP